MPHDLMPLPTTDLALLSDDLDLAKELVREELAASTRAGYARDMRLFIHWCDARGVCPLPASGAVVAAYVGHLVREGHIRGATLSRRVAALAWAHRIAGHPDPTKDVDPHIRSAVRPLLRAARRRLGTEAVNRKAALSPDMLLAMLDCCPNTLMGQRDRAMLSIGWALALRRGELVALQAADIEAVPGGIHVRIRRSKTDQLAKGTTIAVPDRARDRIRPARDLRTWLRAAKIKQGSVFVRVNKAGRLQDQLDGGSVGLIVKKYARLAGLDVDTLGGHSLRTGFVTSAAATGASVAQLANVTRHSSADVLLGYVRTANLVGDYPVAILK